MQGVAKDGRIRTLLAVWFAPVLQPTCSGYSFSSDYSVSFATFSLWNGCA